jgi:hypothetical protein
MINNELMIVNFENIIQWFYYLKYVVRVDIEMFDQFDKWMNEEIAIQRRCWLHVCLNNVSEIQIHLRKNDDETYDQTLIDWLNKKWLN